MPRWGNKGSGKNVGIQLFKCENEISLDFGLVAQEAIDILAECQLWQIWGLMTHVIVSTNTVAFSKVSGHLIC